MSAHIFSNLLKSWGNFHNDFNKFNNTRARMLYAIYHMILRLLEVSILL